MIFPDGTIFPSKSDITIPSNGTTTDTFKGGLFSAIIFKLHVGEYLEAQASLEILQVFLSVVHLYRVKQLNYFTVSGMDQDRLFVGFRNRK